MVKRRGFLVLSFFFILFLSFSLASANFACGVVTNKDNQSVVSPSWFSVKLYYSEKPLAFTSCTVSPDDNKYCCNPREIQNVSWAIGKTINVEINDKGYFAEKKSLQITGAGYDVFSNLEIEKLVDISKPNSSIYVGIDSLEVSVKTASKFNSINYSLFKDNVLVHQENVCVDCNANDFYLNNLTFGKYSLYLTAFNLNESYTENFSFSLVEYINFQREIECTGCSGLKIPSSADLVNITIIFNSSHEVSGILSDIFPSDWAYQGELQIKELTESHNSIEWDVQGSSSIRKYSLVPPNNAFNARYTFQLSLDSAYSSETIVQLTRFWFINFISFKKDYLRTLISANIIKHVAVSQENPIVIYPNYSELTEVVIFPIKPTSQVSSYVRQKNNLREADFDSGFIIWSSLDKSNLDKITIKFNIDKKNIKEDANVSLKYYDSVKLLWTPVPISFISEKQNSLEYSAIVNNYGGYLIDTSENG